MTAHTQSSDRFTVLCCRCAGPVIVRDVWVGREVRCPHCSSVLRVPAQVPSPGQVVRADAPLLAPRRHFNFACPNCESLLEANTGMSGQPGRCPTCGARFLVPHVDSRNGLPSKATVLEPDAQNPTPVHAYGASGAQAPHIVTDDDGHGWIVCPRCEAYSEIDADNCSSCGTPFTMEGTPTLHGRATDLHVFASLFLGLVALATSLSWFVFFPGSAALLLGGYALYRSIGRRQPWPAFVGVGLGFGAMVIGIVRLLL